MKIMKKHEMNNKTAGYLTGLMKRRSAGRQLLGKGLMALVLATAIGFAALPEASAAAKKQLSEKAVKYLMSLTWAIMPDKIKDKSGKEVPIDKNKRDAAEVPLDDARRVIMGARRSAHAQICKLPKLQKSNYRTILKLELDSKKWTRKQIVYLNQLHLFTVMWLTGNVSISADEGKKDKKEEKKKEQKCTPEQKAKVRAQIEKYLKENPVPQKAAKK
ncbi:MAG: hypothetical protein L3J67_00560 [Hyphomicrobiaceae bacterium]|nr:hypothetical protein [Hyphomicrobiaceae bacterium]